MKDSKSIDEQRFFPVYFAVRKQKETFSPNKPTNFVH
jgi:hypothetical protein